MNINDLVLFGLDPSGRAILGTIKRMSRYERLGMVRQLREGLSKYSRNHAMDSVQLNLVRHSQLVETICRRYDVIPEIKRRMRTDTQFHRELSHGGFHHEVEKRGWNLSNQLHLLQAERLPVFKRASKRLKARVNAEWEREVLAKYNY